MDFKAWRSKNKFQIQSAVLSVIVLGSFAIYWALSSGYDAVAWVFYVLVTLGFGITMALS